MYPYLRLAKLIYTKAAIPEILAETLALLSVAVTKSFRKGPRRHGMGARNRILHFYVEHASEQTSECNSRTRCTLEPHSSKLRHVVIQPASGHFN